VNLASMGLLLIPVALLVGALLVIVFFHREDTLSLRIKWLGTAIDLKTTRKRKH
jgi:hypothetical protein